MNEFFTFFLTIIKLFNPCFKILEFGLNKSDVESKTLKNSMTGNSLTISPEILKGEKDLSKK